MDTRKRLEAAIGQVRPIVAATRADQLGAATGCPGWDVRGLLNHLYGALVMFRDVGAQGAADMAVLETDLVGADPLATYDARSAETLAAWSQPGRLDQPAAMPWGPMPADLALGMLADDVVVHGWDLARATGQQVAWDDVLVEDVYSFAKGFFADEAIRGDSFAPPVPCADDASPIDRLVAFLGRQPV